MNIVIINCFDTYEHRVDLLHDVLTEEGHRVSVLTSDFRHFEKVRRTEPKTDYVFFEAQPYKKNLSFQRIRSHVKLSRRIFGYLSAQDGPIDLIWVLVPPNSFVKDAAEYKKSHAHTKVIFDLIDLWPETMPVGSVKSVFPFTVWRDLRDKNIKCADAVVTECALYQDRLKDVLDGIRTETLYLARPLSEYVPHLDLPDDRFSLCYLGSINNIIDIDGIRRIILELKDKKPVTLHIIGDGERKDELISAAEQAGASVVFHGKVYDRGEKQRIFDSCHYGLNIMKESVCVGLTMKSMDYLEFGLPMINNIHGDTWDIIGKENIGYNTDALSDLDPGTNLQMRRRARQFFEERLTTDSFRQTLKSIIR